MRLTETTIAGAFLIEGDRFLDKRGSVMRAWAASELESRSLDGRVEQSCLSANAVRGTLRGMHYQTGPADGAKTVRVTRGAIFDVAIDLRPHSSTFCRWFGVELREGDLSSFYIPAGCAHGYQTLEDNAEVFYLIAVPFAPTHQAGVRWDDPAFGVRWPLGAPTVINDRDRGYPDFTLASRR